MQLENVCIILVEPQGPLNIGSVSRAMMNFGLSDLRLVNPVADHLGDEARRMAVKAGVLLENARLYGGLEAALADCHYSLATTRRFGKYRENFFEPEEAAKTILPLTDKGRVALVFGREDHGLSTAEIGLCQHLLTIPSHQALRSLNLAQSVTVCLHQLFVIFKKNCSKGNGEGKKLANGKSLADMFRHMRKTLVDIEYLDEQNPDHIMLAFRNIFGRAQLNEREVRILQGLWSRIDWIEGERQAILERTGTK